MKISTLLFCIIVLAGCKPDIKVEKPAPFNANCRPLCREKCDEPMLGVTADPDSAIAAKKNEHILRMKCDERRDACVQCLDRAIGNGAIAK